MLTPKSFAVLSLPLAALLTLSCNSNTLRGPDPEELPDLAVEDMAFTPIPPKIPGCKGKCTVNYKCPPASGPTTLTGVVNIPSGSLPLYNAKVYIPTGNEIPPPPA